MSEALIQTSGLPDILWNFSHFDGERRLTLAEKPRFYEHIPTPHAFDTLQTEDFAGTLYVLTNIGRQGFPQPRTWAELADV
jgi:hypothetical protein